jgi:hypothetical protein
MMLDSRDRNSERAGLNFLRELLALKPRKLFGIVDTLWDLLEIEDYRGCDDWARQRSAADLVRAGDRRVAFADKPFFESCVTCH